MRRMPWATYLWPGLPQIWTEGHGPAWLGCRVFVLVNSLLLATLVWNELLSRPLTALGWLAVAGIWFASIVITVRRQPAAAAAEKQAASVEDLFCSALSEYLKGHWFEAEAQLGRLFEQRPRDIEARLLLATLCGTPSVTRKPGSNWCESSGSTDRDEVEQGDRGGKANARRGRRASRWPGNESD